MEDQKLELLVATFPTNKELAKRRALGELTERLLLELMDALPRQSQTACHLRERLGLGSTSP